MKSVGIDLIAHIGLSRSLYSVKGQSNSEHEHGITLFMYLKNRECFSSLSSNDANI